MRVPIPMVNAFKDEFEVILTDFLNQNQLLPEPDALKSKRFLTRSVVPHVEALSQLFNRIIERDKTGNETSRNFAERQLADQRRAIDQEAYWSEGGNPQNRRLAYFLSFMPGNLYRVASVWSELHRLGFRWPFSSDTDFRGLEWGAGTASGACGVFAGEKYAPLGLPANGSFALIEQSKAALTLGAKWFEHYTGYSARSFHRRVDLSQLWLPKTAPKFHLFVMSFFLNECDLSPEKLAENFILTCENHLEEEGLTLMVEPALKLQSRKLLEFRKALLAHPRFESSGLKILLPCLGHQACGALAKEDDWCHEETSWWRPAYLRDLDSISGLDRKTLAFSYLVIQKTKRTLSEIFPELKGNAHERYRLVSPSHSLSKKTSEFFICGQEGKRRARYLAPAKDLIPDRGDILQNAKLHGDPALSQIESGEILLNSNEIHSENEEQDSELTDQ